MQFAMLDLAVQHCLLIVSSHF